MKKFISIILMMFLLTGTSFAVNGFWDFFNQKNHSRNVKYRSANYKKQMHKRSQKAYKKMCKGYFYVSAFNVKTYGKPKTKKNGKRK